MTWTPQRIAWQLIAVVAAVVAEKAFAAALYAHDKAQTVFEPDAEHV